MGAAILSVGQNKGLLRLASSGAADNRGDAVGGSKV